MEGRNHFCKCLILLDSYLVDVGNCSLFISCLMSLLPWILGTEKCCLNGPPFLSKLLICFSVLELKPGSYYLLSVDVLPTSMFRFLENHYFLLFLLLVAWFLGKEMEHLLRNLTRLLPIRFAKRYDTLVYLIYDYHNTWPPAASFYHFLIHFKCRL